jgi:hypothetical protein
VHGRSRVYETLDRFSQTHQLGRSFVDRQVEANLAAATVLIHDVIVNPPLTLNVWPVM